MNVQIKFNDSDRTDFYAQINWNMLLRLLEMNKAEIFQVVLTDMMHDTTHLKCKCFCHKTKERELGWD